jgi:quercetin dioxygenase-like cupin family protein
MVEENFVPLIPRSEQPVWIDQTTGFRRRSISPPAQTLAGEVLECKLEPGTHITYDRSSRPGLEHHLLMIEGQLEISIEGKTYELQPGDCLRYQISGPSTFTTPVDCAARYLLFIV